MRRGRKEGLEKGLKQGRAEGLSEGLSEGRRQEKCQMARNLMELGVTTEIIIQATGLRTEEIAGL